MAELLTALSADKFVRVLVTDTTDIVQQAFEYHHTSPVVSAALGRLLTAASMMGTLLKNDDEKITLQILGEGPIGTVLATADCKGNVKGYAQNSVVDLPLKPNGKLDVSGAIGQGTLCVLRDNGLSGVPYVGRIPLVSGEIAEDITSYYATSEQTPTVCALGVLVDTDLSIKSAGGILIQLLPGAPDETVDILEKNITEFGNVSGLLLKHSLEEISEMALNGIGEYMHIIRKTAYKCDCSREKSRTILASLAKSQLDEIIREDRKADIVCSFCNSSYHFEENELLNILEKK